MKKSFFAALSAVVVTCGCAVDPLGIGMPKRDIEPARRLILDGKAECVLVKKDGSMIVRRGGGVSPLMEIYDLHREEMAGGIIVDKVIGRAAAAITIRGKVTDVYGEIMSEDAVEFLNDNGVRPSWTKLVPRILNQKRDGRCPLELSVDGIDDPEAALKALKAKIASFGRSGRAVGGEKTAN